MISQQDLFVVVCFPQCLSAQNPHWRSGPRMSSSPGNGSGTPPCDAHAYLYSLSPLIPVKRTVVSKTVVYLQMLHNLKTFHRVFSVFVTMSKDSTNYLGVVKDLSFRRVRFIAQNSFSFAEFIANTSCRNHGWNYRFNWMVTYFELFSVSFFTSLMFEFANNRWKQRLKLFFGVHTIHTVNKTNKHRVLNH